MKVAECEASCNSKRWEQRGVDPAGLSRQPERKREVVVVAEEEERCERRGRGRGRGGM